MLKCPCFSSVLTLMLLISSSSVWAGSPAATTDTIIEPEFVSITVGGDVAFFRVVLAGPSGRFEYRFEGDETALLDLFGPEGEPLADGLYNFEITADPLESDGDPIETREMISSGVFTISAGFFVVPTLERGASDPETLHMEKTRDTTTRDQVVNDDAIVTGSLCVGSDCANGEIFGSSTVRLKDDNLRLEFQDTSNPVSFPSNDWQITINDDTSGGADKFSIEDLDGATTPFTIEAGAPDNGLFLDDNGYLGLGTSTPADSLHLNDSDTPTVRFEQNVSGGLAARSWDLGANEVSFFVRDTTNSATIPFEIEAGAPANSLYLDGSGNLGLGNANPTADLHLQTSDGTGLILIEDTQTSGATGNPQLKIVDYLQAKISLENTFNGMTYDLFSGTNGFRISNTVTNDSEFEIAADGSITMGKNGNDFFYMSATGDIVQSQDLTVQQNTTIGQDLSVTGNVTTTNLIGSGIELSDFIRPEISLTNGFTTNTFDIYAGTNGLQLSNSNTADSEFEIRYDNTIRMGQNGNSYWTMTPGGDVTISQDLTVNGNFNSGNLSSSSLQLTDFIKAEVNLTNSFSGNTYEVFAGTNGLVLSNTTTNDGEFQIKNDNTIRMGQNGNDYWTMTPSGDIGFRTTNPQASLHLLTTDGSAQLRIEDTNHIADTDAELLIRDYAQAKISLENTFANSTFDIISSTNGLRLSNTTTTDAEFMIKTDNTIQMGQNGNNYWEMSPNGDVTIANDLTVFGTFSNPSDVNLKEEFQTVDPAEVLEKLVALPIMTWQYERDQSDSRHMGVMAQDFYTAFGLGKSDRALTTIDPDGVAMAAIQGLHQKVVTEDARITEILDTREARIAELENENAALEARISKLEGLVEALLEKKQ